MQPECTNHILSATVTIICMYRIYIYIILQLTKSYYWIFVNLRPCTGLLCNKHFPPSYYRVAMSTTTFANGEFLQSPLATEQGSNCYPRTSMSVSPDEVVLPAVQHWTMCSWHISGTYSRVNFIVEAILLTTAQSSTVLKDSRIPVGDTYCMYRMSYRIDM